MNRIVQPELLDELPPDDLRAVHSRRDLRLLNWLMRHEDLFCAALADFPRPLRHIAELGAGDGSLMLKIAQRMHQRWPNVHITLVDQQKTVSPATLARFADLGWQAEAVTCDVFAWLDTAPRVDVIIANLFLHHFEDERLSTMLRMIAERTELFIACETRRTAPAFIVSRLLWCLGCNSVTRHDARLSMYAGFRGDELVRLWPSGDWKIQERGVILFTHLFVAERCK